jgi:multiple sugar transport system permease protein
MLSMSVKRRRRIGYYGWVMLFLTPALIGMVVFNIWPMVTALINSFANYNLIADTRTWVGIDNYTQALFKDVTWYKSLEVTLLYVLLKLFVQTPIALGLALVVQRPFRGVGLVRGAIYAPVVTAWVIVSVLWKQMFQQSFGIINSFLAIFGIERVEWLADVNHALLAITIMSIWKDLGFVMIIFLTGLQVIPDVYYEAAAVDGANPFDRFLKITLPLLQRTTLFIVVITTISAFQVYTPVYIMTQGGPQDATKVVTYYIFQRGFLYLDMGYASTLSILLFILLLVISLGQMRLLRSDLEY